MAHNLAEMIRPIAAQMAALGAALTTVRLASIIDAPPDCPAVLALRWATGARLESLVAISASVESFASTPPPDYRLALPPSDEAALDAGFLAAAWALGAWDVARTERLPLAPGADPLAPMHGICHLVTDPYQITGSIPLPAPVDAARWCRAAARLGWITWVCKPLWCAPRIRQDWISKDRTLQPDGSRLPRARPWTAWEPVAIHADHQSIIRLGRAPHGNRARRQT